MTRGGSIVSSSSARAESRATRCPLTHSPGPHYTARPGSRVPMFTSRCITPVACVSAHPDPKVRVRRSSVTRFVFSGSMISRARAEHVLNNRRPAVHMTQRILTRIDSPRFTGSYRFAASWCAPVGALGADAYAMTIGLGDSKRHARGLWRAKQVGQMGIEGTSDRTSMSGKRPLDREGSGAGSRWSAGAP